MIIDKYVRLNFLAFIVQLLTQKTKRLSYLNLKSKLMNLE